jgi:hypothetical protein
VDRPISVRAPMGREAGVDQFEETHKPGRSQEKGSPKPLRLANLGEPMHRGARAEGKGLATRVLLSLW